ncbi:dTDP-4-dehydrorhamnose reductase [Candidatus Uhrbacteria bacterium CG10_big_fil_rev_8_21_14_0_10_41_26]|nr:MAG: dTDP-4-dehydrorhamnose reductase [Candidatus Uhrbacteria bacterium CG10_big_fil_rev_8_21_14_0_10_41_26]
MKIIITGAQGILGQQLVEVFKNAGHEVISAKRQDLDITNKDQVLSFVQNQKPDVIINAAAYNFVDKVEDAEFYPLALAINADGPRNLALAARENGALVVHYSSDYVFEGTKQDGYDENDEPRPISKYGQTKLEGEKAIQESTDNYYICRTAKIFGAPGSGSNIKESFPSLMLQIAKEKPELKIVDEEFGSPTYVVDIAQATLEMIKDSVPSGIYHLVNEGEPVTWYGFAKEVFDIAGVTTPYNPISSSEFNPRPAARPVNSSLKNTKWKKLRPRLEALREFLEK